MSPTHPIPEQRRSKGGWIWFAYTSFLFIGPLIAPKLYLWLGTLAVFAIFFFVFKVYMDGDEDGRSRRWTIVATLVLGVITFPWNEGGTTFFVFAAAFLPFCFSSMRRVLAWFVGEVALVLLEGYILHSRAGMFHSSWINTFSSIFFMLALGIGNVFRATEARADRKLRAVLEDNVELAAVAERERIARDLHDVLGHTLSVIVLKAELAGRLIGRGEGSDPQRAATEIGDVERIARTALAEVREAIGGYRARGLAAEIEAARLTLDAAGVTLIVESDASGTGASHGTLAPSAPTRVPPLSASEETALSLVLREAVTNIVRHARASTCRLRLVSEDHQRRLIVEDDGEHPLAREGNGLRGMRERVESLGGHFSLERDGGTRLLIELPRHTGAVAP